MKIEVSNGEIIDKLSILEIKLDKIVEPAKISNIQKEYDILLPIAKDIIDLNHKLVEELRFVNNSLWEIEDDIREKERKGDFSQSFIDLARSVYKKNDVRARIKKEINQLTNSALTEEKSYEEY